MSYKFTIAHAMLKYHHLLYDNNNYIQITIICFTIMTLLFTLHVVRCARRNLVCHNSIPKRAGFRFAAAGPANLIFEELL